MILHYLSNWNNKLYSSNIILVILLFLVTMIFVDKTNIENIKANSEEITEEIIIAKLDTKNSIDFSNSNYIEKNYEMTREEQELQKNNKTIKIIPQIEFDESREDRIIATVDVNTDYTYNETDFYINNNIKNVEKKEIEINISVLEDEKMVEVCVFYYEDQHDMICKQLDILDKNIVRSKFILESNTNNYFAN
ncbi:MAG: hypothetical protein ACPKPY_00150 [Nitrososphaeraceae archaeon]